MIFPHLLIFFLLLSLSLLCSVCNLHSNWPELSSEHTTKNHLQKIITIRRRRLKAQDLPLFQKFGRLLFYISALHSADKLSNEQQIFGLKKMVYQLPLVYAHTPALTCAQTLLLEHTPHPSLIQAAQLI